MLGRKAVSNDGSGARRNYDEESAHADNPRCEQVSVHIGGIV